MLRRILVAVGVVGMFSPKELVGTAARFALENPEECELRSWVVPAARAEGVLYLLLARRGDTSYSAFKGFLGVIGLLLLWSPRRFVHASARLAYTDARNCEWKSWVYPVARLFGVVYVLVAVGELRRGRSPGPEPSSSE